MTGSDSEAGPASLNYFNYFTEIEDTFVRRRKKHLFLSPLDWALMETWKEQEIPLHIVLRGIERAFDSFESKPRKRSVKSLLYCQEEVEAQFAEWLEARVGANDEGNDSTAGEAEAGPFSLIAVRQHIHRSINELEALAGRPPNAAQFLETLSRTTARLREIEEDLEDGSSFNSRRLEDSLTGLERMLNESMFASLPTADFDQIKAEVKSQLRPYRSQMDADAYKQTENNLILKSLREKFSLPRLSLFYL